MNALRQSYSGKNSGNKSELPERLAFLPITH
jgi:hypothetical protein